MMVITYRSDDEELNRSFGLTLRDAVLDSALHCANDLESERLSTPSSWKPSREVATMQLLECLEDDGWTIYLESVVTIP